MKANYQSVNTFGGLCEASAQSIVECRLQSAEVVKVLLCEPRVVLEESACDSGEVRYGGKLLVSFLYEDASGKLCRAERGAEFFHKAENVQIAPAHTAVGGLTVQNVKLRREGGQLIASCVIEAKFTILGSRRHTYVIGGEDLLVQKSPVPFYSVYTATATVEEEDEFECDFAQDILLHSESVGVTDVRASIGEVETKGELCLQFCMLRSDGSLCSYERITPIKAQVLLDNAMPSLSAKATARILSTHVSAATDEERGKSKIVVSYRVEFTVTVYEKTETEVAVDAYSTEVETELKTEKIDTMYALNVKNLTERVHGTVLFSEEITADKTLLAVVFPRSTASLQTTDSGTELQGAIEAKALYRLTDGGVEAVDVTLPFIFPIEVEGNAQEAEVECRVYGFGLRVRAGGETEAEATLKLRITTYEKASACYLTEVTEGEKKQEKTCGISVYVTAAGEDLWTTAKRLSLSPQQLLVANPQLTFPLKGEERIIVYRQKREKM